MKSSQTARNRANAAHSTGPKTVDGRARSSQNSFEYGIYSQQVVIPGEDRALFDELRAELQPAP